MTNNTIISLQGVSMNYGERPILENIGFSVDKGDFIAITGPNGGGKTTFLRIILGLLKPVAGKVEYFAGGKPARRLNVGYLPQKNAIDSHFPITIEEVIQSGLANATKPFHRLSKEERRQVDETLSLVGLTGLRNSSIGQLSGGQLQRALLGRAIISKPEVLVLDEPLSYIDKSFEQVFYNIIATLAATTTILLVSHEITAIARMATRHVIIDRTLHECHAAHHGVITSCE